ncbi:DNA polymerase [Planctomycetales bacterium]|nr:DNA polymerase [Planctomycetales bacterium]
MKKLERVENLLRLALSSGIGATGVAKLLRQFGDSDAILGASETQLRKVEDLRPQQLKAVLAARDLDPRPELDAAARANVRLLPYDAAEYPAALLTLTDPPFLLYIKGKLLATDGQAVGIVGTRAATRYGREQADFFAAGLARLGYTVVSGLARGIDTAAHRGALAVGGRTAAFVGCGFNFHYPPENRDLAAEIAAHGAVLSEFTMNVAPDVRNFPRRNRLIAGMSLGTLVVEAPVKSGAMITARLATEMGREVFAIPGRIDSDECSGCHQLIRDGAVLTRRLDDILEELPPPVAVVAEPDAENRRAPEKSTSAPVAPIENETPPKASAGLEITVSPAEKRLLDGLTKEPMHLDELAENLAMPVSELAASLLMLELRGLVKQLPGKLFVRGGR